MRQEQVSRSRAQSTVGMHELYGGKEGEFSSEGAREEGKGGRR